MEFPVSQPRPYHFGTKRTFPTRTAVPKTDVAAVLIRAGALVPVTVVLCCVPTFTVTMLRRYGLIYWQRLRAKMR
jgi:hypothetical protein